MALVKAKLSRLQETISKECVGEHATDPESSRKWDEHESLNTLNIAVRYLLEVAASLDDTKQKIRRSELMMRCSFSALPNMARSRKRPAIRRR